jgi:hypothetical protein
MAYYAHINTTNNTIGKGQCPCSGDNIVCLEITEEVYNNLDHYMYSSGDIVLNPNYEQERAQKAEEEFNRQFFNTSLGYVRREVTMKDGSKRDFLSDILPLLAVGVPILTYTRQLEQSRVLVTEQFLNECKQQMLQDFYGV